MSDWFDEGGSGNPVDVQAIWDSDRLHEVLARMVQAGAMISMGTTSDGGALGLTVTVDGRWRREYFRDGEAMLDWLMGAEPHILRACAAKSASSASRGRTRSR